MKPHCFLFVLLITTRFAFAQSDTTTKRGDTAQAKTLSEVVVKSRLQLIENRLDKIILNPEAMPSTAGQTALDLLRSVPGVVIDAAENVQMGGKSGVTVLIDGKPTELAPQDLAQLLKSITADNIKTIEAIANPSARYDAAGNAGIINIRLKRSLTNGTNGSLSGAFIQSNHARQNASGTLNWRKDRWTVGLNGTLTNGLQHTIATNERFTGAETFLQESLERDRFGSKGLRAVVDYSLNKYSTFGGIFSYNTRFTRMDNSSTSLLQKKVGADTMVYNQTSTPFTMTRRSGNLNYAYRRDKVELNIDGDLTAYNSGVNNDFVNDWQNAQAASFYKQAQRNYLAVDINVASLKADYTRQWGSGWKGEAGAKAVRTLSQNNLEVASKEVAGWQADSLRTNRFRFREVVMAAYGSVSKDWKKVSLQAGLRAENTDIFGTSIGLDKVQDSRPDTAYLNLFPSLFLQYRLSATHQFGLALTRRIDRPSYQDQNPFFYSLDAFNSEQGNPYLQPQFTNSAEASYGYKSKLLLKLRYSHTEGLVEQLTYTIGKGTLMIPQNAGSRQMVNFSVSTPVTVAKWWNAYLSAEPYFHHYQISLAGFNAAQQLTRSSVGFNGYASNTFTLSHDWKLEISGWYNFQNRATIYTSKPLGSLNIGAQKKLANDKLNLRVGITDLFNTQRWEQRALTNTINMHTYRKWESRNITVSLNWRWGNGKIRTSRDRNGGKEDEVNRIK